jgi:hypothetical protein
VAPSCCLIQTVSWSQRKSRGLRGWARTYAADEARAVLLTQVTQLEELLGEADREPSTVPPVVQAQWQQALERLRAAANQIGRANTRDRARSATDSSLAW